MSRSPLAAALVTGSLVLLPLAASAPADAAAPRFANCTAMNKVHPHGVGRPRAVDKTSGTRVTTFRRDLALYQANAGSDRDGDGIACEKL